MECMENKKFKIGQNVYAVERGNNGETVEYYRFRFVAQVKNAVILSPYDLGTEEIIEYMFSDTRNENNACLLAFPISDCYETEEEAIYNCYNSEKLASKLKQKEEEKKQEKVIDAILSSLEKFKEEN